jgi:aerobic C4-dicarboxylate transport protein
MATNVGAVRGAQVIAQQASHAHASFADFLLGIFIGAFVRGDTLQVLVIAVIFGFGLLHLGQQKRHSFETGLQTISSGFFAFIHIIMRLAPIGTFGAMAFAIGTNGTAVLMSLLYMVVLFHVTTFLFVGVVLGAVSLIFRFNMIDLLRFIGAELVIVYGTASSEAVLPRLLEKLPQYGASRQTVGLVLPTGYSFNLDGAALFMSFSIIFLANAYNVPLSLGQQIGILVVMMLTSKGVAAVAGGAFVVFAATVTSSGIVPIEGLALIFGVYRFMSMLSALCNVVGNAVATIVVAKLCGEFQPRPLEANAGPVP